MKRVSSAFSMSLSFKCPEGKPFAIFPEKETTLHSISSCASGEICTLPVYMRTTILSGCIKRCADALPVRSIINLLSRPDLMSALHLSVVDFFIRVLAVASKCCRRCFYSKLLQSIEHLHEIRCCMCNPRTTLSAKLDPRFGHSFLLLDPRNGRSGIHVLISVFVTLDIIHKPLTVVPQPLCQHVIWAMTRFKELRKLGNGLCLNALSSSKRTSLCNQSFHHIGFICEGHMAISKLIPYTFAPCSSCSSDEILILADWTIASGWFVGAGQAICWCVLVPLVLETKLTIRDPEGVTVRFVFLSCVRGVNSSQRCWNQ